MRLKPADYKGRRRYFVTSSTDGRRRLFVDPAVVAGLRVEILRTCEERQFRVLAYVFMEDHLHLLIEGVSDDSDFKSMFKLLRQRTAIAYRRQGGDRLWQDGYFDRTLRATDDVCRVIRYIRDNPARAGLPAIRMELPYLWWTIDL